jgi:acetyl-CoA acetyltransferase family protein
MGPHFLADGISELYDDVSAAGMWIWAEHMAEVFDVSRSAQDEWALLSHHRALAAAASGRLADEIYPFEIETRKGTRTMDRDEGPRPDTSAEALAALEPRWKYDGTVTPGNSSPLSDGACVTVLASGERGREFALRPLTRIISWAVVGIDPEITGYSPVHAIPAALKKVKLDLQDIGLFEINEAFAVMMVTSVRDLGLDPDKVNVNGGAIALGHPVGMSGNRLLLTLSHEMKTRGVEFGVVSLCAAGGLGIAAVLQNAG